MDLDGTLYPITSSPTYSPTINVTGAGRAPTVWKSFSSLLLLTSQTIWTPASGKKFRLMGYAVTSSVLGGAITLKDGGNTILIIPALVTTAAVVDGWVDGILSQAANNSLSAIGSLTQTMTGYVYGTEE